MWAGMLELGGAAVQNHQLDKKTWFRAISVGVAGLFGGYAVPFWLPGLLQWARSIGETASVAPGGVVDTIVSQGGLPFQRSTQALIPSLCFGIGCSRMQPMERGS